LSGDTPGITILTRLRLAAETFSPGFFLLYWFRGWLNYLVKINSSQMVSMILFTNWRKLTVKLAIRISERTSLQLIIR
jgi:hypothetical protein